MSKQNARSWKLVAITTAVMVGAAVLILNVGASAHKGSVAAPAQQSPTTSSKPSGSPKGSTSPSPSNTCGMKPPAVCTASPPNCVPNVNCPKPSGSASASTGTSPSPSTSPTPGGGSTYKSTITLKYVDDKEVFKGRVDSKSVCEKGRRVDLFEVTPGKDTNLGHTLTARKGKYKIPFPNANGRYYSKVKKSTPSRNTTCKGAQSKTISV